MSGDAEVSAPRRGSTGGEALPDGAVTLLLTDLVFTTGAWETEPDQMAVAVARHDELTAEVVGARGGVVIKNRRHGDAPVSVFRRPSDAAGAAADLQRAVAAEEWPTSAPPQMRVALHTVDAQLDGDVFATAVNWAARLRSFAEGGEIVCSQATAALIADALPVRVVPRDHGPREPEDISRPERVFSIDVPGTPVVGTQPPRGSVTDSKPFVGRTREVDRARRCAQAAISGDGGALLIVGEAGIGKTRLAERAVEHAASLGARVVWGRCVEEEGAPPFWPWRQILDRCVAGGDRDALVASVGSAAADLAAIVPSLGVGGEPPAAEDAATARFRLFEAVTALLRAVAGDTGLVVVLDDLHWADPSSALLLAHLGPQLAGCPILLVGTCRDQEVDPGGPVAGVLAALGREPGTVRLALRGLTEVEIADQLQALFGRHFEPAVVAGVSRRSGGNPFFVAELGRLLDQDDAIAVSADGWESTVPEGVRALVSRRVDRLFPAARRLASVAAILRAQVDVSLASEVAGMAVDDALDAIGESVMAGILAPIPGTAKYRFTHDLVRETLQLEVGAAERARLHLRCAEILERSGGADPARIAHHRLAAWPLGDGRAALDAAVGAARAASAQLAVEDAARLYRDALAILGSTLTPEERMRLLLESAAAHRLANDVDTATRCCEELADLASRRGDAELLAAAALALEGLIGFPRRTTVGSWCSAALAALPNGDSPTRARLLAELATAAELAGDSETALQASADALAMADRLGDARAQMSALRARQTARSGPDGNAERLALADRMLGLAAGAAQPDAAMWGHLWRFDALMQTGRVDDADAELDRLARSVDWRRVPLARWHLTRSRAAVHLARGRFNEALLAADEVEGPWGVRVVRMMTSICTGREMGLTAGVDAIPTDRPDTWIKLALAGATRWNLAFGRRAEAVALYERISAMPGGWRPVPFSVLILAAYECEAAAALGDRVGAADAYRALLPYRQLHVTGGAGVIFTGGSAEMALGRAAHFLGDTRAAVAHLQAAVAANDASGLPPLTAEARYHLAKVLAARGRPGDAEEALRVARASEATAVRLGMAPLLAGVRQLIDALRGGGPSAPLTRREGEVADLVAAGRSNREIALLTHISERTAENHVQHILVKLGFANRAQIAAWVAGRRGPSD